MSYVNKVEYAILSDTSWADAIGFGKKLNTSTYYSISYELRDINNTIVVGQTVSLAVDIYELPPSYLSLYLDAGRGPSGFFDLSVPSIISNALGIITFS